MADFVSPGWSLFIIAVTALSIVACFLLAMATSSTKVAVNAAGDVETTGHVWDEDLVELNNPLPRWWLYLFYITCVFGALYLVLYPGAGAFKGTLGWSQVGQYENEMAKMKERIAPLYARFQSQPISAVAKDPEAVAMGERLYLTYCVQCHGSDARGSRGFPNLTDKDWLGAGDGDYIKATIINGRQAVMPPMGAALGGADAVDQLANYVASLSKTPHDPVKAALGQDKFGTCAACHGADGKGNAAIGAPNLTDNIWLHGRGVAKITEAINLGINNQMPSFGKLVGEDRAHVLAAYVLSLSQAGGAQATTK